MGSVRPSEYTYAGEELDLFAQATTWKAYWSHLITSSLRGDVLEVGAGIGANAPVLLRPRVRRLVCLEPDRHLVEQLQQRVARHVAAKRCEVRQGTVRDLGGTPQFDAVLYIDVLEHIEDDAAEAAAAAQLVRPGGHLVVLAPAHDFLFSPFDKAIGHFRRYSKQSLAAVIPTELRRLRLDYLDAAGLLASLANRLLLRASKPTTRQVVFWDSVLVPLSRWIDPATGYRIGKSVLGVWRR